MLKPIKLTVCDYPESDGKPMGETDLHRDEMLRHIELLRRYFAGQRVYVSGNLLVYYEQGNPKKFVVPDAFVTKGVSPNRRRIYKIWQEQQPPHVIIETTSRKTRKKDENEKPKLYRALKVREYFMFDPEGDYLDPVLQGYRLVGNRYKRIVPKQGLRLLSEQLELYLEPNGEQLEFLRADGSRLLTAAEECQVEANFRKLESEARQREAEARQREAEARQREAEARQAAEAEVRRLKNELSKRRGSR